MLGRVVCMLLLAFSSISIATSAELSDDEIRALLIEQSQASYPGNCPCPYFVDRAGRQCGARSAYSKQGGHSPLCYARDVTKEMIEAFRAKR
jgi:hypothetical protein